MLEGKGVDWVSLARGRIQCRVAVNSEPSAFMKGGKSGDYPMTRSQGLPVEVYYANEPSSRLVHASPARFVYWQSLYVLLFVRSHIISS